MHLCLQVLELYQIGQALLNSGMERYICYCFDHYFCIVFCFLKDLYITNKLKNYVIILMESIFLRKFAIYKCCIDAFKTRT